MVIGIEFIFQATRPLERGELKRKGGGKKTILFNRSEETVELILRTVISVNQLSIYGAVADLCTEFGPDYNESEICESLVIPTESVNANTTSLLRAQHHRYRETCCKICSRNSQNFLMIKNCQNSAKMLVSLRRLRKDSSSSHLRKDLRLSRQHV